MGIHSLRPSIKKTTRNSARLGACFLLLLAGAGNLSAAPAPPAGDNDLLVVDCLLPQKVRRLGRNNTYLAPRQPIRTTAADCRVRGGEYTEPDQATYATSLKIWLPQAEAGDAEAMYYVGQIYEKGFGTQPDFKNAADWYRKAADKGFSAAAANLGSLYEQGLGVDKNEVEALNWYRKAAGLAEDLVVLEAAEFAALQKTKTELDAKAAEAEGLRREIEELRRQLEEAAKNTDTGKERQATLESLLKRMEGELAARQNEVQAGRSRIAALEKEAASTAVASGRAERIVKTASLGDIPFGQYHALVIGNAAYSQMPALIGADGEAREVAGLLEKKYGFKVRLLLNAKRVDILEALNDYREKLTQKDNFLIYYAGHGQRDEVGQSAWWQPVDADPQRSTRWIGSGVLTEHLDLIAANHVFVVANSVFGGLRTRSSVARLPQGMTAEERFYHIKVLTEKRARLVLASGAAGDEGTPKMPAPSFAGAFLETLRQNDGVLEASALYQKVNDRLHEQKQDSSGLEFAAMKWARNDLADFFFVPATLR